jgi:hypothetical protein
MVCSTIRVSFAPECLTKSHPLSSIKMPQKLARRGKGLGWSKEQSPKSGDIERGSDDSLYATIILSYHIVSVLICHISYIAFNNHIQDDYPITSNQIHYHWDDSKPIFSVCGLRPRKIIVLSLGAAFHPSSLQIKAPQPFPTRKKALPTQSTVR